MHEITKMGGQRGPASTRSRAAAALGPWLLAALLTGCADPTGPVVGDWRNGSQAIWGDKIVELVLDGSPDATSGRYRYAMTIQNTLNGDGSGEHRWSGEWTRQQGIDGRPIYHLKDDLPGLITWWELTPDGQLHPATPDGRLDTRQTSIEYILFPVPHGYGYGRL